MRFLYRREASVSQVTFMGTVVSFVLVAAAAVWAYAFASSADQHIVRRVITIGLWRPGGRRGVRDNDRRLRLYEVAPLRGRSVTAALATATAGMPGGAWRTAEAHLRDQRCRWEERELAAARRRGPLREITALIGEHEPAPVEQPRADVEPSTPAGDRPAEWPPAVEPADQPAVEPEPPAEPEHQGADEAWSPIDSIGLRDPLPVRIAERAGVSKLDAEATAILEAFDRLVADAHLVPKWQVSYGLEVDQGLRATSSTPPAEVDPIADLHGRWRQTQLDEPTGAHRRVTASA